MTAPASKPPLAERVDLELPSIPKRELANLIWRDESADLATLNIHCIEINAYHTLEGWFMGCEQLSMTHMHLPSWVDTLEKAKSEALRRAHGKLVHFAQLAELIQVRQ